MIGIVRPQPGSRESLRSQGVTARSIVRFPDSRLRQKAEPIVDIDNDVRVLAQDLYDTMVAAPGIGITAPHMGVLKRLVVLQIDSTKPYMAYVNPRVVWSSQETIRNQEG